MLGDEIPFSDTSDASRVPTPSTARSTAPLTGDGARCVLVTGGAGYIGSHVVHLLLADHVRVVVVDDLSTGAASRVRGVPFVRADLAGPGARERLTSTLIEHEVTDVLHFAAVKRVGDSVRLPTRYFDCNVGGLTTLLSAMEDVGVRRLVFSSSAAVYGEPRGAAVSEDEPCRPVNPYGQSKLVGEWMVANAAAASGASVAALRYFNVAGAGRTALADLSASNLVPIVVDAVLHGRPVPVFGTTWDTSDGSCVRDYVHVLDVARAHLAALDFVAARGSGSWTFNLGTGRGASVLDVVRAVERVSGRRASVEALPPRLGDPAVVVADPSRAESSLGWRARCSLDDIVESTWQARAAASLA